MIYFFRIRRDRYVLWIRLCGQHLYYPCAIVTVTSTKGTFPKTITVDFGTGCTDKRGVTRKGKIIITVTNKHLVPSATITVVHDNFYVDGKKVEVPEGTTILQAAAKLGIDIPTLCYLKEINALEIGKLSCKLGSGRVKKEDNIDYDAGVILKKEVGSYVKKGDILCTIYGKKQESIDIDKIFKISKNKPKKKESLIIEII